jgi:NAD+ diphosphatase
MPKSTLFPLGEFAFLLNPLDRAAHMRADAQRLLEVESDAGSRAYVIQRDSILVKRESDGERAAITVKEALAAGANPGTIFLGLRDQTSYFGMGLPVEANNYLPAGFSVEPVRNLALEGRVPTTELSAIATAKSMVHWHQRHSFCPNCGARTQMALGGWKRECPSCHSEHFPRTDPVVIMLVTDGDRVLLGRQKHFPKGNYSCLAGFVEPAETIEDAVRREILEEAGIECTDVRYYKTQPWPFPYSLMIGCTARAVTTDLKVDYNELEDARWFTRDDVLGMIAEDHPEGWKTPAGIAIAQHIVRHWARETD